MQTQVCKQHFTQGFILFVDVIEFIIDLKLLKLPSNSGDLYLNLLQKVTIIPLLFFF